MENFQDFLPFVEDVSDQFNSYHIEAATLTIDQLRNKTQGSKGSLIGRVLWKSPLLKRGTKQDVDTLHFTVVDAQRVEVTGVAWANIANEFHKVLTVGNVYKFTNALTINRQTEYLKSRLNSPVELRFSGLSQPELVNQDPFPDVDHDVLRPDMENLNLYETVSIVGLLVNVKEEDLTVILSMGIGKCFSIKMTAEKFVEFKALDLAPWDDVLGIFGCRKMQNIDNYLSVGPYSPRSVFEVFDDTLLIPHPKCKAAENLEIWNNELMVQEVPQKQC